MSDKTPCAGGRTAIGVRRESPGFVRLSAAAAMTLGLRPGRFYRNARLHCLNLLLTYEDGCLGRCAYCGLSRARTGAEGEKSFIRVDWPTHSMDEVIERMQPCAPEIERVCISMVTRRRAVHDVKAVSRRLREISDLPVSLLVAPTMVPEEEYAAFRDAGADRIGIAIDAATPELFERFRGRGIGGPHEWERYRRSVVAALRVFDEGRVGVHLIVGLGETEREMAETIQGVRDLGARTHLFSFFPEEGSALDDHPQPPVGQYRRVQLARFLIDEGLAAAGGMSFSPSGKIERFGLEGEALDRVVNSGLPFRTSGCPGKTNVAACNRPYANCLPGPEIRNYPFAPNEDDVELIKTQIWS